MTARYETPPTGASAELAAVLGAFVPDLAGERVALRAPRVEDFATYADIVCGPRGAHVGGPMTRDAAWLDFIQMAAGWLLHGHGGWTVTAKQDDAVLGFVLLGLEPGDLEVELGFLFRDTAEGQGFAYEAALAARDWAALALGLQSLVSYVDAANARAIALATRMGATRDATSEATLGDGTQVWRHHGGTA